MLFFTFDIFMTQFQSILTLGKYKLSTPTLLYALIPLGIRKNTSFPEVFFFYQNRSVLPLSPLFSYPMYLVQD